MKKTLYIFRHGETNYNVEKRMQGWLDIPLNENGVAQAHALAKKLHGVTFDCVYSSSSSRALDTARIVVGNNDTEIITDDGLREHNFGDFCGNICRLTEDSADTPIKQKGDVVYIPFDLISQDDYIPPNGESHTQFVKRVLDTLNKIVKNTDAKTIGIATHTGVAKVIIQKLTPARWTRAGMPNAEFFKLEHDGKSFSMPEIPDWLSPVLMGADGNPLVAYHGTYYEFDYFRPLTHFGKLINAQTNLNEGKWKRDPNIDIAKPKIIPVNLSSGRWAEIPDLNDHSVQNYLGILFQYMCADKISEFNRVLNIEDKAEFDKQITLARQRVLDSEIDVPWEFDWVCEPIAGNISTDAMQAELKQETLFDVYTHENLFLQRMILFLEKMGLVGFKYKNYTEGPGSMSYINLRQNSVVRTDKKLPAYQMPNANQVVKLRAMRSEFRARHKPRKFTTAEKEMLTAELIGFTEFRFKEIKYQSQKSWAKENNQQDNEKLYACIDKIKAL